MHLPFIVLFLYRNRQYVIRSIMSSSSFESCMLTSVLQRGIAWKGFSNVIKLRIVLRPVYVVPGIHRDPESEHGNQISQYLQSIKDYTGIVLGRDIEIFSHIFPKKSHCYFEMTNFYHWNLIRICAILELVWNSPIVLQVQAYPCYMSDLIITEFSLCSRV